MRGAYVARRSTRTAWLVSIALAVLAAAAWMVFKEKATPPPVTESSHQESRPPQRAAPVATAAVSPPTPVPEPTPAPPPPPVVLIEGLACRTVETNDSWTRFSWQATLRAAGDPAEAQARVTLLDGAGFTVDESTYPVRVTSSGVEIRDLRLVGKPQEETITTVMLVLVADGQVLDEMRSPVERLARPREETQRAPRPAPQAQPAPERRKAELWGRPRILVSGSIVQTGIQIWNPGATMTTVNFEVELHRDGDYVDSVSSTISVPPGGRVPYNHTFETDGGRGHYTVSVKFW